MQYKLTNFPIYWLYDPNYDTLEKEMEESLSILGFRNTHKFHNYKLENFNRNNLFSRRLNTLCLLEESKKERYEHMIVHDFTKPLTVFQEIIDVPYYSDAIILGSNKDIKKVDDNGYTYRVTAFNDFNSMLILNNTFKEDLKNLYSQNLFLNEMDFNEKFSSICSNYDILSMSKPNFISYM